jgi:hypothetical protein
MARGRKSKLTPQLQEKIIQYILASNYFETACWGVGITPQTGYNWLKRGENCESGSFRTFYLAVMRAEAEAEISDIAYIKAGKDNWQARSWIRERRSKERWGKKDYQEVKLSGTLGLKAEDLTDDELAAIIKSRGSRRAVEKKEGKE